MTDYPPLSAADAVAIARIVTAARDGAPLMRLVEGRDNPVKAQARAIVLSAEHPYSLAAGDDVRGACLWVTTDSGFEHWWPLSELVPELISTTFIIWQRSS